MKNLNKIKERVFEVSREPELANALFPGINALDKLQYAYAVYLAGAKPKLVLGHVANTLPRGWKTGYMGDFRNFIMRHPPRSFMDLVFLLDFFHFNSTRLHHRYDPNRLPFSSIGIVNNMLKESRGVLLWHYQLENLLRLFVEDSAKVAKLRKGINVQSQTAYDQAKGLQLTEKDSLDEVITERMLFFSTCSPNCRGAWVLFGCCE
ncbi:MAG: hypothetical protein QMD09_10065 [Desulfatibacillaceae bacterium]|nr:hypothetical protein [Desulfatibacillaceae bacterium]